MNPDPIEPQNRTLFLGVGLVSFAALLLELSLTRVFSVVLFYHFAFLAISIALLGLGAGGVFAFVRRSWLSRRTIGVIASASCLLGSGLVLLALYVVLHSRITLELSRENFLKLTLLYLVCAGPFFCCGVLLSVAFARTSGSIPRLYGADLAGGALACLLTVPALNWLGAPNAILCAALVLAVTAGLWSDTAAWRNAGAVLTTVFVVLLIYNWHGDRFDIVYAKGTYRDRGSVEFAKWNAISRVEVINPGGTADGIRSIVIDADASTYIPSVDPQHLHGTFWEQHLTSSGPLLVNALRPRGDFAIIGPGGGEDILRAIANGSTNVSAAEINPTIVNEIMRGEFADLSKHLYDRPEVHIHLSDGRSFVRQSRASYDVVQMTLVDTWASTAAGAFALSENNLYTVQAFREYFDHLKPDGILAITRWEFKSPREALRVVSNAIAVLQQIGATDITRHFIIISDGTLDEDGRPVLVLAKKSPFTPDEEETTLRHLEQFKNLSLIYSPSDRTRPAGVHPTDPARAWNPFTALIESRDPADFASSYEYDVSPVTDDAPFFFYTLKLHHLISHSPHDNAIDWKVNLGVLVLFILLGISIVAVLAFLVLPLALHAPARGESPQRLLFFVAIGLGYILVEITLIQRFVLFLGHPVYALTVVIFLMLLSSGLGSLASHKWLPDARRLWFAVVIIAAMVLLYVVALPVLLPRLVGLTFTAKLLISALLLIPLGLIMGTPFPTGLRAMAANVEWAWALNAASSVLGSVIAMFIAIQWGLRATLLCAAAAYVLAALLSRYLVRPASR
ncbi:MAG: hypothetical protein QOI07_1260 [Verrucomicrobiota bacterium]|jgi:hypothetical protein